MSSLTISITVCASAQPCSADRRAEARAPSAGRPRACAPNCQCDNSAPDRSSGARSARSSRSSWRKYSRAKPSSIGRRSAGTCAAASASIASKRSMRSASVVSFMCCLLAPPAAAGSAPRARMFGAEAYACAAAGGGIARRGQYAGIAQETLAQRGRPAQKQPVADSAELVRARACARTFSGKPERRPRRRSCLAVGDEAFRGLEQLDRMRRLRAVDAIGRARRKAELAQASLDLADARASHQRHRQAQDAALGRVELRRLLGPEVANARHQDAAVPAPCRQRARDDGPRTRVGYSSGAKIQIDVLSVSTKNWNSAPHTNTIATLDVRLPTAKPAAHASRPTAFCSNTSNSTPHTTCIFQASQSGFPLGHSRAAGGLCPPRRRPRPVSAGRLSVSCAAGVSRNQSGTEPSGARCTTGSAGAAATRCPCAPATLALAPARAR